MQTQTIRNKEKLINNIMFAYIFGVGLSGFAFVIIFLNGGLKNIYMPASLQLSVRLPWRFVIPATVKVIFVSHIIIL